MKNNTIIYNNKDLPDWKSLNMEQKSFLLGGFGEQYSLHLLKKKFPEDKYLILLNTHDFFELDWIVINKESKKIVEIYEIKTTTKKDSKEFSAGSLRQLLIFDFQKQVNKIPAFLWVLRINPKFWDNGDFEVIKKELYSLNDIEIDLKNCKWKIKIIK